MINRKNGCNQEMEVFKIIFLIIQTMKRLETMILKVLMLILKWQTKFKKKWVKYYKDLLNNKVIKVKLKKLFFKIFCQGH